MALKILLTAVLLTAMDVGMIYIVIPIFLVLTQSFNELAPSLIGDATALSVWVSASSLLVAEAPWVCLISLAAIWIWAFLATQREEWESYAEY